MITVRQQRGSALLIALVAAALATVIALTMIERGQGTLARTQALMDTERAFQYARGMEILAIDLIEQAISEGIDASLLDGAWTAPFDVPGGLIQGRVLDQNAYFNVNALAHPDSGQAARAQAAMERLLNHLGLNPIIAAELADWISAAAMPRPGSVGDSWYAGRQPPYRMAGVPLAHISELRWLRSVDEDAWTRLSPFVAALPDHELLININTTRPEILAGLVEALDLDQARRVLADGPFADTRGFLNHPVIEANAGPDLALQVTAFSPWYLAQARVVLDGVERDYFRLMHVGGSGYDFRLFSQGVP
jgi:general secretion pathway protein K